MTLGIRQRTECGSLSTHRPTRHIGWDAVALGAPVRQDKGSTRLDRKGMYGLTWRVVTRYLAGWKPSA